MVLRTHDINKIKGAAYKNSDVDGTCKRFLNDVWKHPHYTWTRTRLKPIVSQCSGPSLCPSSTQNNDSFSLNTYSRVSSGCWTAPPAADASTSASVRPVVTRGNQLTCTMPPERLASKNNWEIRVWVYIKSCGQESTLKSQKPSIIVERSKIPKLRQTCVSEVKCHCV